MIDPTATESEPELLGSISCPSGILLVLDGGWAWVWSHDRSPVMPEYPFLPAARADARDLIIRGRDAILAAAGLGGSSGPYLFDQPGEGFHALQKTFAAHVRANRLEAMLEILPERVPHRRRVDLVLAATGGAGVVEFSRMTAAVLGGVSRDRLLPIWGEPIKAGPWPNWRRVWVELGEGQVATTRDLGSVSVDEARLMAIDADALGAWEDRTSLDGKADVVFWGGDATALAEETGATANLRGEDVFGWADMPVDDAAKRAEDLMGLVSTNRRFAVDFRPHTHQFAVMAKVRAAPTESATLALAGAQLCMFMTSWGDGSFPVALDRDADGRPLRLRIEFASDDAQP